MFMVRRSLPPYPISMTFRASGSIENSEAGYARSTCGLRFAGRTGTLAPLLHRGMWRRVEDDRLHLDQDRCRLGKESLPLGILHHLGADGDAVVEIVVGPEVHHLVELSHLRLPEPDVLRVPLPDRHDGLEVAEPLPGPAHRSTVGPQLVDVSIARGRLHWELRREQLVLLGQEHPADLRQVPLRPRLVLGELATQSLALVEVGIRPEMADLIQRAELGEPVPDERAVL